jgi:hypothetical protein
MELKNECVSLELAKKMKELGFKQESLFYWQIKANNYAPENEQIVLKEKMNNIFSSYSAYTVAELGEMLPAIIEKNFIETSKCSDNSGFNCCAGYLDSIKNQFLSVKKQKQTQELNFLST